MSKQNDDYRFSHGLQNFKARLDLTQDELAGLANAKRVAIAWVLTDRREIKYDELASLIRNGMSLDEAFGPELAEVIKVREFSKDPSARIPDETLSREKCREIVLRALMDDEGHLKLT